MAGSSLGHHQQAYGEPHAAIKLENSKHVVVNAESTPVRAHPRITHDAALELSTTNSTGLDGRLCCTGSTTAANFCRQCDAAVKAAYTSRRVELSRTRANHCNSSAFHRCCMTDTVSGAKHIAPNPRGPSTPDAVWSIAASVMMTTLDVKSRHRLVPCARCKWWSSHCRSRRAAALTARTALPSALLDASSAHNEARCPRPPGTTSTTKLSCPARRRSRRVRTPRASKVARMAACSLPRRSGVIVSCASRRLSRHPSHVTTWPNWRFAGEHGKPCASNSSSTIRSRAAAASRECAHEMTSSRYTNTALLSAVSPSSS